MDLIELNEAFASQALAVLARVGAARRAASASTSTARASRSATRSARPAGASSRRCCARCAGAARAMAWRPCASAAGRAWRRCSRTSPWRRHRVDSVRRGSEDAASATNTRGKRPSMTGVLYGIAKFCIKRRFVVLAVWLVVDDRARRGVASAGRQHQRQPVAARHRQPGRHRRARTSRSPIRPTAPARSCCTPTAAS